MTKKNVFGNFYCTIFSYIFLNNTEGDVNWAHTFIRTSTTKTKQKNTIIIIKRSTGSRKSFFQ